LYYKEINARIPINKLKSYQNRNQKPVITGKTGQTCIEEETFKSKDVGSEQQEFMSETTLILPKKNRLMNK